MMQSTDKPLSHESISNVYDSILIVDDEYDIIKVFKRGLEYMGFRVSGFTEPASALEHFQINHEKYGLIISDFRMPGMNGFEFIKKIKEIKPEIKALLMTSFDITDAEFEWLLPKVKIEGLIQKPISLANLFSIVSRYVFSK